MEPPRPDRPHLALKPLPSFSDELFRELATAVKGRVLRPPDPEYFQHTKTFNGKLKPLCRGVVVPVDAHDVSATVKFCAKYGLSPSVRAGGYGIAGWAVAGDVVIDLSMLTDIDIEPPKAAPEGDDVAHVDWTPLKEMPPLGSKGKAKANPSLPHQQPPPHSAQSTEPLISPRGEKRRRDDRSPPASEGPESAGSFVAQGPYDAASHAVAAFLRGPPLPPDPGEPARQPPLNRPRLHSPDPADAAWPGALPEPAVVQSSTEPGALEMPPLSEGSRQLSGESNASDESSQPSTSGFNSRQSQSSVATTAPPSGEGLEKASDATDLETREPFAYMTPGTATPARLPMYSGGAFPSGSEGPSAAPALGAGISPLQSGHWPPPTPWPSIGASTWSPSTAFGTGMPAGVSSPSMPLSMMPGLGQPQPYPPPAGSFGIPPFFGGVSDARTGPLGTMQHSKPVHPHAYVTFGAGLRQKEIDSYTADHPLEGTNTVTGEKEDAAVPYHVPMSAHPVGSSIMLLGGFGFISRLYGLSIDNLVEVEMVLADGRIVVVNAEEDPELWWAIRGAGPAFGVATRYKARAFPVPVVFAGNLIYRFHRATAPSLIKHFRDCIKNAPRELYANVLLTAGPADKDSLVVIQMCYVGPKEKGVEYLQAISSWDGERCLLNEVNEKSFLNQQDSVAQVLRGKAGRQWFLRSALITTLPDEVINKTVMEFADTPIGCTWLFELAGGAIGDFEDNCLPKEQREATWTVAALHQWDMGIDDPRCITTAEQWMGGTIRQVAMGGPYPTFLGRHEPPSRTMACFGKNWDRLAALKRKYDPHCLFKNNFWPLDRDGRPIELLVNEPPSP
ncbi:hypothetical protein BD414DRAFT_561311 [Trametes punicea]|nr:hypothetical protein BD414DRAFT_561311 [Trametes punicea]